MLKNANPLIQEFLKAAERIGFSWKAGEIFHELVSGPHKPPAQRPDMCAIYVFSLTESFGRGCAAGPHRVLKVGQVGANSGPRFQYQHYRPGSAQSTVAGSLLAARILWPFIGIDGLSEEDVKDWLLKNTDRDHFYFGSSGSNAEDKPLLTVFERYMKGRIGPVLEGISGPWEALSS